MKLPVLLFLLGSKFSGGLDVDCTYSASYPGQYVTYRLAKQESIDVDGRLDDLAWTRVAWSEKFVDISTTTVPRLETRVKMRWDDRFLYVAARISEPETFANISSTCHCNSGPGSESDQVVFHDNDFEIFVDADGSTHYYKEFEVNAANATWDLCLNKPYDDGGYENSTRVFGTQGFDDLRPWGGPEAGYSATYVEGGKINDPTAGNTRFWSVEVALPLDLLRYRTNAPPAKPGDFWRINFSRVEWAVRVVGDKYWKAPHCQSCPIPGEAVEDNWVWSRQGVIDMHRPERWGFLQFADERINATKVVKNNEWTVRSIAAAIYYAEHAYFSDPMLGNGTFTESLKELKKAKSEPPVPIPYALSGICSKTPQIQVSPYGAAFQAYVQSNDGTLLATVRNDRYIQVRRL
ncbi:hypothetical protein AAMO2058_001008500 [Amorphochlora amoebiformis]